MFLASSIKKSLGEKVMKGKKILGILLVPRPISTALHIGNDISIYTSCI